LLASRDLEAWHARMAAHADHSTVPGDVLKQLESLGYIKKK
jgi:hypothetical protein